ncbi:hypothetical protein BSYN_11290 [Bacteroides sedimenti]|uniref:T9SS type A sorting domain-containing protein n=2 Tax=Bacteroides sedimenti TaxID=2136147 RepID=A0ABN6Z2W6_9BACE
MSIDGAALKLVYTCADSIVTRSSDRDVYYYVFNIGENNGFVIVSGDDRAKDILGYSDGGSFDINFLPPNFVYWLDCYKQELRALMEQPDTAAIASTVQLNALNENVREATYATSVAPLLGKMKWNQDFPFNNFCPFIGDTERAPAGCVVIAMAQVMKYYKWPVSGTGSNTYTPKGFTEPLSVDFSQTTYDWDNMLETYTKNGSSTQIQNDAVATLIYHAGVASSTDYNKESRTNPIKRGRAMIDHFGYDSNMQLYERDYYSKSEWVDKLKEELNVKRPVIFEGNNTKDGHAFVCDGYDVNNLFHFNWGWGGVSDGYYELSALNVYSFGYADGFNWYQSVTTGIQKAGSSSSEPTYQVRLNTTLDVSSNSATSAISSTNVTSQKSAISSISVSGQISNNGINNFVGKTGIALYNQNGFVLLIDSFSINMEPIALINDHVGEGWTKVDYNALKLSEVAYGNYQLYSVYKANDQADWQIMRGKVGTPNYLNVTITSSEISINYPDVRPKLTLNSLSVTGNLYQNKTGRFNVNITNNGGEYNSIIRVELFLKSDIKVFQRVSINPINIPAGETKSFDLLGNISLAPGEYYLVVSYDPLNDRLKSVEEEIFGVVKIVNILSEPAEKPLLMLTSKISLPDSTKVSRNEMLTANIKNVGGYFNNKIIAFIFQPSSSQSISDFGFQTIFLDKNEEKTIDFKGYLNLDPGNYIAALYYRDETDSQWIPFTPYEDSWLSFTLVNDPTSVKQTSKVKPVVSPNPVTDKLCLQSDEVVEVISIMDLSGKQVLLINPQVSGEIIIPVEKLTSGVYIIQLETTTGMQTCKFIKK